MMLLGFHRIHGLELGVAISQAHVSTISICIYSVSTAYYDRLVVYLDLVSTRDTRGKTPLPKMKPCSREVQGIDLTLPKKI